MNHHHFWDDRLSGPYTWSLIVIIYWTIDCLSLTRKNISWILQINNYIGLLIFSICEYQNLIGSLSFFEKYLNYVKKWTSQFWEMEEFHAWSMADHLLRHYWNGCYNTFLEIHLDVCNFAKRVDFISVNERTLNSIRICYYFGLHFGWWTMLLNLAHRIFYSFPRLSKRKSCDQEFK